MGKCTYVDRTAKNEYTNTPPKSVTGTINKLYYEISECIASPPPPSTRRVNRTGSQVMKKGTFIT